MKSFSQRHHAAIDGSRIDEEEEQAISRSEVGPSNDEFAINLHGCS
jgi:hypothetical protein